MSSTVGHHAEGLRALCHELYEPQTVSDIYAHITDIADAASYIEQIARQLAQKLHGLDGAVGVDSMPSSFNDPTASAIGLLFDAMGRASDLYCLLNEAGQAASHLYDQDES